MSNAISDIVQNIILLKESYNKDIPKIKTLRTFGITKGTYVQLVQCDNIITVYHTVKQLKIMVIDVKAENTQLTLEHNGSMYYNDINTVSNQIEFQDLVLNGEISYSTKILKMMLDEIPDITEKFKDVAIKLL